MVFCVAFGCSNGDNSRKSFFSFPLIKKSQGDKGSGINKSVESTGHQLCVLAYAKIILTVRVSRTVSLLLNFLGAHVCH